MNKWQAVGNEIWESHADGDYLVATVQHPIDKEKVARLIAAAPSMLGILCILEESRTELSPQLYELIVDVLNEVEL